MSQPSDETFEAPSLEELNQRLPSYHFEKLIAKGGMGAAYRARQISLDRQVCIKILPHEFVADAQLRTSFENEARSMARLNHPNLVSVYDFGDANGLPYITMSYEPGGSLYYWAYGRQIPEQEALPLVIGMCEGMAHAHENGILHCDLKPANILLDAKNQARIGDFGLARLGDGNELAMGTPGYTAPEVLRDPTTYDARADIYSIGVILYELLVGKRQEESAVLPSVASGCDAGLDAIWKQATNLNPSLRYRSFQEFAADLKAVLARLLSHGAGATPATTRPSRATGGALRRPGRPAPSANYARPAPQVTTMLQPPPRASQAIPPRPVTYIVPRKKSSGGTFALIGLILVGGALMYKQIIPNSIFPKSEAQKQELLQKAQEKNAAEEAEAQKQTSSTKGTKTAKKKKLGTSEFGNADGEERTTSDVFGTEAGADSGSGETSGGSDSPSGGPSISTSSDGGVSSVPSIGGDREPTSTGSASLDDFVRKDPTTVKARDLVKNAAKERDKASRVLVSTLQTKAENWYLRQTPTTKEKWESGWGIFSKVLKGSRLPETVCMDLQGKLPEELLRDLDYTVRKQQELDEGFRKKMTDYRNFYVKYLKEGKEKQASDAEYVKNVDLMLEKTDDVDRWVDGFGVDMKPLVTTPAESGSTLSPNKGSTLFGTPASE